MYKTKIFYDMSKSTYFLNVDRLRFYFSSEFYRDVFRGRIEENRKKINASLSNRFKMNITFNQVADLFLYQKVEKRGFRVELDGVSLCQDNLTLNGESKILTCCGAQ